MNGRILVVEDSNLVALDISTRLKRLGYEVAGIAAYGEDAVEQPGRANGGRPQRATLDAPPGSPGERRFQEEQEAQARGHLKMRSTIRGRRTGASW